MLRLWFIITAIISTSKFIFADNNWELAAAVSDKIDLMDKTGYIKDYFEVKDGYVTTLAYDPKHRELYFNNDNDTAYSIFQLDPFNKSEGFIPIVTKQAAHVKSMAVDTMTRTLYWVVGNEIKSLLWDNEDVPSSGSAVYTVPSGFTPVAITIDVCNRELYWVIQNQNTISSVIQKSKLTDKNETVNLYETSNIINGIYIDPSSNQISWIEEDPGSSLIYIKGLSLLANVGEKPEILIEDSVAHTPTSLTKVDNMFFWTNGNQQFFSGEKLINGRPYILHLDAHNKKFYYSKVYGLISVKESSYVDSDNCHRSHSQKKQEKEQHAACQDGGMQPLGSEEKLKLCSDNNKSESKLNSSCEVIDNRCDYYCLNGGLCRKTTGNPQCSCSPQWAGERCEIDSCANHCQNGGTCYFEYGNKKCRCTSDYKGDRCEEHILIERYLCIAHCSMMSVSGDHNSAVKVFSSQNIPVDKTQLSLCRCPDYSFEKPVSKISLIEEDSNKTLESLTTSSVDTEPSEPLKASSVDSESEEFSNQCSLIYRLLYALAALCLLLMGCITILILKIASLRKRPRIKKRIIVNKNVTPLTSRPQTTEQCEITIENCCNMNICETPCFEPDFRKPPSKEESSKKEEKKSLLTSIDLPPDDLY